MAGTISVEQQIQARTVERADAETRAIPWYIWCCLASVVCAVVGSAWDISWHESVGRDTFWTAAHMLVYLSGILAGISCAYLILSTTFQKNSPLYDVSVSMWGFRGPLGAFICAWGGVAMIASAPFDNWWHNSYGLDVKILSPPHVLLALGMIGIRFGTLVMVLAEMNRAGHILAETVPEQAPLGQVSTGQGVSLVRGLPEVIVMTPTARSRLRWLTGMEQTAPR